MLKFLQYLFTYRNLQQKAHWGWFHSLSFVKLPNLMATISSHLFLYPVKLWVFFIFKDCTLQVLCSNYLTSIQGLINTTIREPGLVSMIYLTVNCIFLTENPCISNCIWTVHNGIQSSCYSLLLFYKCQHCINKMYWRT